METSSLPHLSVQHRSQGPLPQKGRKHFVCSGRLYPPILGFRALISSFFKMKKKKPTKPKNPKTKTKTQNETMKINRLIELWEMYTGQ